MSKDTIKNRIIRLLQAFRLAKNWIRDRHFGTVAENIVYKALRVDDYIVTPNPDVDEGLHLSKKRRIELAQEDVFKPDALMTRNSEEWFIDVKGKKEDYLWDM